MKELVGIIWFFFHVACAVVGNHIHHSLFWTLVDFFFAPLVFVKWLICHEVSKSVILSAFDFFLK